MNEDEVVEFYTLGSGVTFLTTGIDEALARNEARYVMGYIEVDEFEAEVDRLTKKRRDLLAGRKAPS